MRQIRWALEAVVVLAGLTLLGLYLSSLQADVVTRLVPVPVAVPVPVIETVERPLPEGVVACRVVPTGDQGQLWLDCGTEGFAPIYER
jgi:hypothetical protein